MMKTPRISVFVVGCFGFPIIIFLVTLSLLFLFWNFSHSEKTIVVETPYSNFYLSQEIDSSTNDVSLGYVTLNRVLSADEFLSYSSSSNIKNSYQIIISKFASTQYECHGFCSCPTERRTGTYSLTHPLFLLISALSTTVALKIAETNFHNQCLSSCSEQNGNPTQNIQSQVYSCAEKEEEKFFDEDEYAEYSCDGYCITNKRLTSPEGSSAQQKFLEDVGGCESFKTTAGFRIKRTKKGTEISFAKEKYVTVKGEKREYRNKYKHMSYEALRMFYVDFLAPFCKIMSVRKYWYAPPSRKSRQRVSSFMCVGGGNTADFPDERLDFAFQNIKCTMISARKTGN